jgi:hypothetical protein
MGPSGIRSILRTQMVPFTRSRQGPSLGRRSTYPRVLFFDGPGWSEAAGCHCECLCYLPQCL